MLRVEGGRLGKAIVKGLKGYSYLNIDHRSNSWWQCPCYLARYHLALRIPAALADEAAFLIDKQAAAVGALPGKVLGSIVF